MVERRWSFSVSLGEPLKKSQRLFSRHLQHIMDRFPAITNGKCIRFESLPVAGFADGIDIFEKIHFQIFDAAPFASVAPASGGIEGEMAWGEAAPECIALRGEESADLIERFQVGDRI